MPFPEVAEVLGGAHGQAPQQHSSRLWQSLLDHAARYFSPGGQILGRKFGGVLFQVGTENRDEVVPWRLGKELGLRRRLWRPLFALALALGSTTHAHPHACTLRILGGFGLGEAPGLKPRSLQLDLGLLEVLFTQGEGPVHRGEAFESVRDDEACAKSGTGQALARHQKTLTESP